MNLWTSPSSDVAIGNPSRPTPHVWLTVTSIFEDLIFCTVGEAPEQLQLNRGASFVVEDGLVEDWMINNQGIPYGGFSLRIISNRLCDSDRRRFDEHAGIREFNEEMP